MNSKENPVLVKLRERSKHMMFNHSSVFASEWFIQSLTGENNWQWDGVATAEEREFAIKVIRRIVSVYSDLTVDQVYSMEPPC